MLAEKRSTLCLFQEPSGRMSRRKHPTAMLVTSGGGAWDLDLEDPAISGQLRQSSMGRRGNLDVCARAMVCQSNAITPHDAGTGPKRVWKLRLHRTSLTMFGSRTTSCARWPQVGVRGEELQLRPILFRDHNTVGANPKIWSSRALLDVTEFGSFE